MLCAFCNQDTKVLESRVVEDTMRRRRECLTCNNRFTTYERAVFNLLVEKKDGRQEKFEIKKLQGSINLALGKSDQDILHSISQKIYQKVLRRKRNPVTTKNIGKLVLQELKKRDKLAYLRFASIHKEIEDPSQLTQEINLLA